MRFRGNASAIMEGARTAGWAATRRAGRVIRGLRGCLLCCVAVAAGVVAEADADASLRDALVRLAEDLREENARLREEPARRDAELERVNAELVVLRRLVLGRSWERARPAGRDEDGGGDAGRDLRGRRGAAGPAGGGHHRPVAGFLAPARRRDVLAGVRLPRGGRPGGGCGCAPAATPPAS